MPTSPALNSTPSASAEMRHSAAMAGAVNAIASTSKPSSMLMTRQIATAVTWNRLIGPWSMAPRGSTIGGGVSRRRRSGG